MANPWDKDPIVNAPRRRQPQATATEGITVETPDGQVYDVQVQQPWAQDAVATPSQLAAETEAQRRLQADPSMASGGNALFQGLTFGYADELAGLLAGAGQAGRNAIRTAQGQPIEIQAGDLRNAVTQATRGESQRFAREQPVANIGLQAAGGLLTGGGAIGTGIRGAAITGGLYGAGYGAGTSEGGFAERLPGAVTGGVTGAVTGGAVGAAAPYAQRLIGSVGNSFRNAIGRGASPEQRAALRLAGTMESDAVQTEIARRQALGINSTAADVMGGTSERLIRTAAGPAGPGADAAVANLTRQQANLKPDLISTTRALSEDPRSAMAVREGLDAQRSALATEQYAPAYATPVEVTPEVASALSDEPGRAALRRARQAAIARRDTQQAAEIDALLNSSAPIDMTPAAIEQRARAAGYQYDAYHGSSSANPLQPSQTGTYGPGIYTSTSPATASQYAGAEGAVYPVRVRLNNPLEATPLRNPAENLTNEEISALLAAEQRGGVRVNLGQEDWFVPQSSSDVISRFDPLIPEGYQQPPSSVSAGTLDRVRIALSNRAEALGRNSTGARDIAGGLRARANDINAALESVPELQPARDTYRNLSGAIDAVDNAPAVFTTDPQDFAAMVANYTPEQRQAAIVGVRQEIMDTLGGQRAAGTGTLDRISQSDYGRQNLTALLGPDEAQRYLDIIATRVGDVQRAARISPNTNSQTFGRAVDEQTFNAANMIGAGLDVVQGARGNPLAIARTIDRIRARATMSPEERQAIVELGLGPVDNIERIIRLADEARNAGRPPPREVRAWVVNAQNTLGAQNPVAIELQRLLLPTRAAAQEEQQ